MKFVIQYAKNIVNDCKFIKILNVNRSRQIMTEQMLTKETTETIMICTSCKHFMELDGVFFCKYFDAYLSMETLCIPCDFKENIEIPFFHVEKSELQINSSVYKME
jgi:hypothetical protein